MEKLNSVEQFEETVELESLFLLLKHSTTCPISHRAYQEYEEFLEANPNVNGFFLTVQDARPLSNYLAETYHVKHESPQAFLFLNKAVAWHASHGRITRNTLRETLIENQ
jgi:bacillithiol system protein YtxJ